MRLFLGIFVYLFLSANSFAETQSYRLRYLQRESGKREFIHLEKIEANAPLISKAPSKFPQFIKEHAGFSGNTIQEVILNSRVEVDNFIEQNTITGNKNLKASNEDELIPIVENGPSSNRIDLVFMGDGYTKSERQKFIDDIKRLSNDLFKQKTFRSYLPLFNIYAVFRASNESGIGVNDTPKDTAYRLYREGNTLRAIMPGNSSAARQSCRKAPGCDYPIIVANDPNYGGLGGEFAITTSSIKSGTVVLRHELGHNFGKVGEEYDGGGYFGANYSSSLARVSWKTWVSKYIKEEPVVSRFIDWPWQSLRKGPYSAKFSSDGFYENTIIRLSASGLPSAEDLKITLDDTTIPFKTSNSTDRAFIDLNLGYGLKKGSHTLKFEQQNKALNGYISSLTVHEYAKNFDYDMSRVAAFPNFDKENNIDGYRPTNESCLMRDMMHEYFCPVCQENNWLNFFNNISLIDKVQVKKNGTDFSVLIQPIQLGQFRSDRKKSTDGELVVKWFVGGEEIPLFRNKTNAIFSADIKKENIEVEISFLSPEIRKTDVKSRKTIYLK